MKFDQFMSYYKRKNLIEKTLQKLHLKSRSRPTQLLLENEIFEASYFH